MQVFLLYLESLFKTKECIRWKMYLPNILFLS